MLVWGGIPPDACRAADRIGLPSAQLHILLMNLVEIIYGEESMTERSGLDELEVEWWTALGS